MKRKCKVSPYSRERCTNGEGGRACDECRAARAEFERARYWKSKGYDAPPPTKYGRFEREPMKPHGSPWSHIPCARNNGEACDKCRAAHAERERARYWRKRGYDTPPPKVNTGRRPKGSAMQKAEACNATTEAQPSVKSHGMNEK